MQRIAYSEEAFADRGERLFLRTVQQMPPRRINWHFLAGMLSAAGLFVGFLTFVGFLLSVAV